MRKPPQLEERLGAQRAAQERTRARIAEIRSKKLITNALRTQPPAVDVRRDVIAENSRSEDAPPGYLSARCEVITQPALTTTPYSQVGLARTEDGPPLVPDAALAGLANTLLEAAEFRRTHVVLIWPGEPAVLPLAHGIATLRRWMAGDKLGLRTLWYPVTNHAFYRLHDFYLDEAGLYALARRLVENPGQSNPQVLRSCADKDPLLFAIHAAQDESGKGLRPTFGELIPQFLYKPDSQEWLSAREQYLSELVRHLDSRGRKGSVRAIGDSLGDPRRAPDALFGLHYGLGRHALAQQLRWLARNAPPEVVVLPITRSARTRQPNWVSIVQTFRLLAARIFTAALPGAVVVTDEPSVYERLLKYLRAPSPASRKSRVAMPAEITGHALLWPQLRGDGLVGPLDPRTPDILPQKFDVQVVDRTNAQVLNALERISGAEDVSVEAKETLREAVRFLSVLSTMCGTRASLVQWIQSSNDPERLSETYTWLPYSNRIRQLIVRQDFGAQRPALEKALAGADRLWEASERGSPILQEIESEVRHGAKVSRKLILVVPSDRERTLLQSYLAAMTDSSETAEERQNRIAIEVPWTIAERLETFGSRRIVFAGLYRGGLPGLLTLDMRRREVRVILTERNAEYLRRILPVVQTQEGLRRLRPRLESLMKGLKRSEARGWLGIADRELFADEPQLRRRMVNNASAVQANSPLWRLELDDGRVESIAEDRAVYVYAPSHANRSDRAFTRRAVDELAVGAAVLLPQVELRDALDDALRAHGRSSSDLLQQDQILAHYHREVRQRVESLFGDVSLAEQDRRVLARMREIAGTEARLPESARYWIDVASERTRSARWTPPQGPQLEQHFRWFGQALDFGEGEMDLYWNHVIEATRQRHRKAGRSLASGWEALLLDASSMLSYCGLSRDEVSRLLALALQQVRRIVAIRAPDLAVTHER